MNTIKALFMVFMLFIAGTFVDISLAASVTCPNVQGDWNFKADLINSNIQPDAPAIMDYENMNGIIHIVNQQNCLFYGWIDSNSLTCEGFLPGSGCPLTGAISNVTQVTMTFIKTIFVGTLSDNKNGKYRKANFSVAKFKVSDGFPGNALTGLAALTRK